MSSAEDELGGTEGTGCTMTGAGWVGLLGYAAAQTTLENITVQAQAQGASYAGILAGQASALSVTNAVCSGSLSALAGSANVGFVGQSNASATMVNVSVTATVSGAGSTNVSLVVGYVQAGASLTISGGTFTSTNITGATYTGMLGSFNGNTLNVSGVVIQISTYG